MKNPKDETRSVAGPLLSIDRIGQSYASGNGVIHALVDLSLDIKASEFVCVVGPSGCGKSTLIDAISGISPPPSGQIRLQNKPVRGISPEIGMVFQKYSAFPWMTVQENVSYGPRIRGLPAQRIVDLTRKYIELVGLTGYEHLYPKELSGGMSKRVDIARAYANEPSILLMDEPFAALDDFTRKQMQLELLEIWSAEKRTVLFVTHDLDEATFLADRVVVLRRPDRDTKSLGAILDIDLPRPRTDSLRYEPRFSALRQRLMAALGKVEAHP